MRIAISSRSAAITRTLDAAIRAAGHERTTSAAAADLVLCDMLHPPAQPITAPAQLRLVATPTTHDDEIACPFRPLTLIQRLQARGQLQQLALGHGWALDLTQRTLMHESGTTVSLTEKEASLLKTLAENHPAPLGREALLADIWGVGSAIDTHTLETHIYRLRAKLSTLTPTPCDILTEDGAYRLTKQPAL